jgi:nitrite reductase (cytochrome c-552)
MLWVVFFVAMLVMFGLGLLLASIMQRREEARYVQTIRPIDKWQTDSSQWADNYPREYGRYRQMLDDTTRTKFGGAFPRDYLEERPANVILFAGYGFAKEYRQARGHIYAIEDVVETARTGDATPATCWTCKSPDVPRVMNEIGVAEFYASSFMELKDQITHPIGCLDCHDPETMALRITRPALREAFERQGRDITQASHQEMRSLVCAQCHVEYYFKGEGQYLTFPWDKGTTPAQMEQYYDAYDFADWTHPISGTRIVKMQHPDYEVYSRGIHAYRDVACADCHMPYVSEGGAKFTDHHIQSPLLTIETSCQVCHRWSEDEVRSRVESIQQTVADLRTRAEAAICYAHFDVRACMQAGADDNELKQVRRLIRAAQLRWDYVAAHNGMGIHAPQECTRILGVAIDLAQQCRTEAARILARRGHTDPVAYPDFSTKQKAQALNRTYISGKNLPDLLTRPTAAALAD